MAPIAIAARYDAAPRCPAIAVSESPNRGTVILLNIAGPVSFSIRRVREAVGVVIVVGVVIAV